MVTKSLRLSVFSYASKAILASCAVLFVCLSAPMATAQTFMTEDELLATIPGSSISSKGDKGAAWAQNYSKANGKRKGVIKGVFDGTKYDAKWFVKGGQWCEKWADGGACWSAERVDARSLRMYKDGKPHINLWKLK